MSTCSPLYLQPSFSPSTASLSPSAPYSGLPTLNLADITGDQLAIGPNDDEEKWYEVFMRSWYTWHGEQVKYIIERARFCEYEHGVYKVLDQKNTQIFGDIKDTLDHVYMKKKNDKGENTFRRIDVTTESVKFCQHILEDKCGIHLEVFDPPNLINCANGIFHVDSGEFEPHNPDWLFLSQMPVNFLGTWQQTPYWNKVRKTYRRAVKHFEQIVYTGAIKDWEAEMGLFLVGETGAGKGTIVQLLEAIGGDLVSHTPLANIGEPFGKARLIGKRWNNDREMIIGYWHAKALREYKDILTHEGKTEINEKNVPQYDTWLEIWFVCASNQLLSLPPNTDRKAVFRRIIIDVLDKTQKKDPAFKANVLAEVDKIFTNILLKRPYIIPNDDVEGYVKKVAAIWDYWSNPTLRICKEHLEYVNDAAKQLDVQALVSLVSEALVENSINMKDREVQNALTEALKKMGCQRGGRNRAYYKNIQFKPGDEWQTAYTEMTAEAPKKESQTKFF